LFLAGCFLSLAILARSAFIIPAGALFIFEIWQKKSWQRAIIFCLPLILVIIVPYFYNYLKNEETYLSLNSYDNYGHCFRDPYTFLFQQQEYLKQMGPTAKGDVLTCFATYGYRMGVGQILGDAFNSLKFYFRELTQLITFGGPLILALMLLGFCQLRKNKNSFGALFGIWLAVWLGVHVVLRTSNSDHLMELWVPLGICFALGIEKLFGLFRSDWEEKVKNKKVFYFLMIILFVLVFWGHFIASDRWMFHEEYSTSRIEEQLTATVAIKNFGPIKEGMVAVDNYSLGMINYYTDQSAIKFSAETIKELISRNELGLVFKKFGVTATFGYDEELNIEIAGAGVKVIKFEKK
jgi:hypothetical protein